MTTAVKGIKYDAACRAIAAAKSVDEVKRIRDVSIAMRAYARQAENHDMEADAIEIRMRATPPHGWGLREKQRATVGLAKGGGDKRSDHRGKRNPSDPTTLSEAGRPTRASNTTNSAGGRFGGRSQIIGTFGQIRTSPSNDISMWAITN